METEGPAQSWLTIWKRRKGDGQYIWPLSPTAKVVKSELGCLDTDTECISDVVSDSPRLDDQLRDETLNLNHSTASRKKIDYLLGIRLFLGL